MNSLKVLSYTNKEILGMIALVNRDKDFRNHLLSLKYDEISNLLNSCKSEADVKGYDTEVIGKFTALYRAYLKPRFSNNNFVCSEGKYYEKFRVEIIELQECAGEVDLTNTVKQYWYFYSKEAAEKKYFEVIEILKNLNLKNFVVVVNVGFYKKDTLAPTEDIYKPESFDYNVSRCLHDDLDDL